VHYHIRWSTKTGTSLDRKYFMTAKEAIDAAESYSVEQFDDDCPCCSQIMRHRETPLGKPVFGERDSPSQVIEIGSLKIDSERHRFWRDGEEIRLSPREFDLLAFMMKNAGFALTHVKLLRSIWGPEYGGELEYLRVYVRQLRKKVENDPENPKYILTVPWLGYRFSESSASQNLQVTQQRGNL
jgi:DNA-binding winged helix-turn-helix (wHTH) protein